jgi:uncharacterized protein YutE (UPF0331/DUF86 family)
MPPTPKKVDRNRWRQTIARHLEEFPRQYAALEHAMAAFGDFDLQEFKRAFNTTEDIEAYNRVQAVERALGRVQNFVAELAQAGSKLAQLPTPAERHASQAHTAFVALSEAGVLSKSLCRRLIRAPDARTTIEHGYLGASAGKVHEAATLIHGSAREFIAAFRDWIEPFLLDQGVSRGSPD